MSGVIQIRDVPDDVHEEQRAAAEARGQSLTRYALAALEDAVRRRRSVANNAEVIRRAKAEIGADVPREATRPRWQGRRPASPTCSTAR